MCRMRRPSMRHAIMSAGSCSISDTYSIGCLRACLRPYGRFQLLCGSSSVRTFAVLEMFHISTWVRVRMGVSSCCVVLRPHGCFAAWTVEQALPISGHSGCHSLFAPPAHLGHTGLGQGYLRCFMTSLDHVWKQQVLWAHALPHACAFGSMGGLRWILHAFGCKVLATSNGSHLIKVCLNNIHFDLQL